MSAKQSFTLSVYSTNNLQGLNVHNHQFLSYPELVVAEGGRFEYGVTALGANASDYTLRVLEGPQGMTIGTVSNEYVVTWDVPPGARGEFVVLGAAFSDGVEIEQAFFLHVETATNRLPRPTSISSAGILDGKMTVSWTGDGPYFQVQRSTDGLLKAWQNVGPVVPADRINGIADDSATGANAFYRILNIENPTPGP